jgi:hypothetical protein
MLHQTTLGAKSNLELLEKKKTKKKTKKQISNLSLDLSCTIELLLTLRVVWRYLPKKKLKEKNNFKLELGFIIRC